MIFLTGNPLQSDDIGRRSIREHFLADDITVLKKLLFLAELDEQNRAKARALASDMVETIRRGSSGGGGINALLTEFSLSSEEGVVLMCLAEALLRVPDENTADLLISEKLGTGDWEAHTGHSSSLFVNAAAWGLLISGKLVSYSRNEKQRLGGLLHKLISRLGRPMVRRAVTYAMDLMGEQFVFAETIGEALSRADERAHSNDRFSYDMLGEGARTEVDAKRYFERYLAAIEAVKKSASGAGPVECPGISVKLSAIHPRYEFSQRDSVMTELAARIRELADAARNAGIGLTIDAEEAHRLDLSLDIIETVCRQTNLGDWEGLGLAVQAYQKRALPVIDWCYQLARRNGRRLMIRLVKGAYWDTEIKMAQIKGLDGYPVFTRKQATDVSFQACARRLLACRDWLYPQFATHNAYTIAAVKTMAGDSGGYEFQRLHGMGEALYDIFGSRFDIPCRIYAPVGEHSDLLAYLVRRLLENGANSSFVNHLQDPAVSLDELIADPAERLREMKQWCHAAIPPPSALYGEKPINSRGFDLADPPALEQCREGMIRAWEQRAPTPGSGNRIDVCNPANLDERVGSHASYDSAATMARKLDAAHNAFPPWTHLAPRTRSEILLRLGDALESHRDELMMLCIKEGGKTVADSLAEVREAVDFCRYYATGATDLFASQACRGKGVVLCISPWNFPLAIFTGQLTAALAAGNTVIAKPSEQTSLIARRVVALLRQCGLPEGTVQLVVSPGRPVGEQLLPDERIRTVLFTGSTETARWINERLARRDDAPVTLVAETGGQNAMIVDSTALPEQVTDDVIRSAFHSAGQRCSSLRVLFLQEEIADRMISLIAGAMAELRIGDPAWLHTDVGPLIEGRARDRLQGHMAYMKGRGKLLYRCELPADLPRGNFFAPTLYEMGDISVLQREVFGPILHIVRYRSDGLDDVLRQINSTGYGLTLGIHSRIRSKAVSIAGRVAVGNVYINRDMVGAVVGVQPFGGRGLSGTGPKAGGPHYLSALVDPIEASFSIASPRLPATVGRPETVEQELVDTLPATGRQWAQVALSERRARLETFLRYLDWPGEDAETVSPDPSNLLKEALHTLAPIRMPGPTGETNNLMLEPRGVMLFTLIGTEPDAQWIAAFVLALLAGNAVLIAASTDRRAAARALDDMAVKAGLPPGLVAPVSIDRPGVLAPWLANTNAVYLSHRCPWRREICRLSIARAGDIIPVLCEPAGIGLLTRFVHEKTVTENTTASGGNVALLAQPD